MTPFLKQVADHYYNQGNIGDRCFVFPNRRSMVFFRKYLADAVAKASKVSALSGNLEETAPLLCPEMYTINDFFHKAAGVSPVDRVTLLLELYDCYKELNPKAEPLDEFIFWGDVILGDFDDVDKYMVDPRQLFTNVSDFKQLQDTFTYLTDVQRKALEGFISHFNDASGKLTVNIDTDNPDVKGRFLLIWNLLYDLYMSFNKSLSSKKIAYEGMVYRSLAEELKGAAASDMLSKVFDTDTSFVFVGLNALNECEKTLLRKLRDASLAEFCWDYSGDMIRDPQNRSSFFMAENVLEFPQASQWDEEQVGLPSFKVLSVPSAVGQAKRLPDILKSISYTDTCGGDGSDCAVVLPDEGLLVPVLNSMPEEVKDINVTMGLPLSGSLIYGLMMSASALQLHALRRNGHEYFYHKHVWDVFSNDLFRKAADEQTLDKVAKVRKSAKYYIPREDLNGTAMLDSIFRMVVENPKERDAGQIHAFAEYQKSIIRCLAPALGEDSSMSLEIEFSKEYYRNVNMLQARSLQVQPLTYVKLLAQIMGAVSVPFKGEPLRGLQIMGPLETRALDFRNIILLSANEGVFPRRNVSSSFIPPELRKGFGLPTYEYQDAVWAYYFYRMISRAETVWMLVDSRTEGLKSGEESRYIKQLEYHFDVPLERYVVRFPGMKTESLPDIIKTPEDVAAVRKSVLSATAVQNYLACPAKFYYATVKKLKVEDEVAETLDYGMFGTIYHDVMRSLYTSEEAMTPDFFFDHKGENERKLTTRLTKISKAYIRSWLERQDDIRTKVKALIVNQLNTMDLSGRNIVVADVLVRYVLKTLSRDMELLEEAGLDSFDILGREIEVNGVFHDIRFKGYIDRLDSFGPGQVRIVDYKTGKVLEDDQNIHDGNAEAIAEAVFAEDVRERPKIAFQFFIYDLLASNDDRVKGHDIYNCVYSTAGLFKEAPKTYPLNTLFYDTVSQKLESLLDEMCNADVPFRRTGDVRICSFCDFKAICGR